MKRQFTSLMLLLIGLVGFSVLAVTPGTRCGKYLRANQFSNWSPANTDQPLKWGDETGTWIYITFPNGFVLNTDSSETQDRNFAIGAYDANGAWPLDQTIIAGSGDHSFTNNNNGTWSQPCYYGGNRNMLWPGAQSIKAIRVNLPNSGKTFDFNNGKNPTLESAYAGTITLYAEIPADIAAIESNVVEDWNDRFVLQLWKIGANVTEPWDNSGGLFQAIKGNAHPIADEYQYNRDNGKELGLKFIEVTDKDEKAAHQWATKANDFYTAEKSTRVFKIDFTTGAGNENGIYVTVPTIADKNITNFEDKANDDERKTAKNVQPFYRSGVRFGFLDTHFDENKDGLTDHLRFVKWGHVFRLNEKSRPLNAFVSYGNDNKPNGFTDDFGTTSWNGVPCKPENGDKWNTDLVRGFGDRGEWRNKRGDSRLLSEYNLWLRAIYLEVADDEKNPEHKHFYLSFVGEYDLKSGAVTTQEYVFIPSEGGSNVTETPNIFTQYNVVLGEPAFQRFYNLDADNDAKVNYLLGFPYGSSEGTPSQQYKKHIGKGQILYGLNYTDSYSSHSERTVLTAAGKQCHFFSDKDATDPIARTISVKAENGKYYDLNNYNAEVTPETDDALRQGTLLPTKFGMLYDPDDVEHAPATVHAVSTFKFPNSIHEEETFTHNYPIVINEDQKENFDLTVKADNLEHSGQKDFFADIHWNALSKQIDGKTLPVENYYLEASGRHTTEWETLNRDWSTWKNEGNQLTHRFDRYHSGAVQNFDYTVDYKVTGIHNWAYATGAVYKKERLMNDGNELYTPEAFRRDNPTITRAAEGVYSAGSKGFRYRLAPEAHVGQTNATYNENVTAIETIGADDNTAVRYYNLQGIETARPVSGQVYLMRRGNTVTKVVIP